MYVCFQEYISQFKFRSVVTQDLIDYFLVYFPELQEADGEPFRVTSCLLLWPRPLTDCDITSCLRSGF